MERNAEASTETAADLPSVAAVLLDMDGTLVDSDAAVERAWRAWSDEHGLDPDAVLEIAQGVPAVGTVRRLWPEWSDERVRAEAARQLDRECLDLADVVPTPGAHQLVATLERLGLPWAVVTSADTRLATARLGQTGINPPLLVTVDDVTVGKPDPQGYLIAARRLGVPALPLQGSPEQQVRVVGDRVTGKHLAQLRLGSA